MGKILHVNTVIANHLVINGYGHWLGNDPRGSGSTELRDQKFLPLGPIHFGRKRDQPSKDELKAFYNDAEELLEHERLWFDERARVVIVAAFEQVAKERGYTCWACAMLRNHAHLLIRTRRDPGHLMWEHMAHAAKDALRKEGLVPDDHPVWSNRPYVAFKTSVPQVWNGVKYIEENPENVGLPRQVYPWVQKYDGWPLRGKG
jgi:hypothetical protein